MAQLLSCPLADTCVLHIPFILHTVRLIVQKPNECDMTTRETLVTRRSTAIVWSLVMCTHLRSSFIWPSFVVQPYSSTVTTVNHLSIVQFTQLMCASTLSLHSLTSTATPIEPDHCLSSQKTKTKYVRCWSFISGSARVLLLLSVMPGYSSCMHVLLGNSLVMWLESNRSLWNKTWCVNSWNNTLIQIKIALGALHDVWNRKLHPICRSVHWSSRIRGWVTVRLESWLVGLEWRSIQVVLIVSWEENLYLGCVDRGPSQFEIKSDICPS